MSLLTNFAKDKTTIEGITLMENRDAGVMPDILDKEITITDFAFIENKETNQRYGVFITAEDDTKFYFAGLALTQLFIDIEENNMTNALRKEGLKVRLYNKESKSNRNRTYVAIDVIE